MEASEGEGILDEEVRFFDEHRDELRRTHPGQYVLIKGSKLLGAYDSFQDAYEAGLQKVGNHPMLIRHVDEEEIVHSVPAMMYRGWHGAS